MPKIAALVSGPLEMTPPVAEPRVPAGNGAEDPDSAAAMSAAAQPVMPPPMMTILASVFMDDAPWPSGVRAAIANSGGAARGLALGQASRHAPVP